MEERKAPRNGLIDVMRLGFAGIVMMYHFYSSGKKYFLGGAFGVEFFTILAGLLMFSAWERHQASELPLKERQRYWLEYMRKRYVRFFWYGFIAFVLAFFTIRIWHDNIYGVGKISDALSEDAWEILLVKMLGINQGKGMLNPPAWTLVCMLFAEFFILGMLTFVGQKFLVFFMPLSVIFGSGYWINNYTALGDFSAFFTFGMLRIYVLTCCGILSYWICQKIKAVPFSTIGRWVLTGAELTGYTVCMLIVLYRNGRYYQFCFILVTTFVLAVSFSGKSFAGSILPANRLTNFCAELSLSVYLTHYTVLRVFRYLYEDINELYRQKFVFLCCALAAALGYTYIMRGVFKMLPIVKEKLKRVMLERP